MPQRAGPLLPVLHSPNDEKKQTSRLANQPVFFHRNNIGAKVASHI